MTGLAVIARLTLREAARRRILVLAFLLGLLFVGLYALGLHLMLPDISQSLLFRHRVLKLFFLLGLYAVNFLTVAMSILTSVDTLAGEIRSGTIQTLAAKPVARWQILLGKWLGFAGMLTVYIALMAGGVAATTYLLGGFWSPALFTAMALIWLEGLILLSVTFLGGTMLSTLATGVLAIGLHGLAFLGGWIEEFGSYAASKTSVSIGIVTGLIIPSESLWRRAAYEVHHPIIGGPGMGPFTSDSVPSNAMVLYAVIYGLVALSLAVYRFERRDL
ncbi:MAG: ABC transporter permease [Bryobacterales bacterium]|nr:ABC transporter permease [Bryobacterales bacterium]